MRTPFEMRTHRVLQNGRDDRFCPACVYPLAPAGHSPYIGGEFWKCPYDCFSGKCRFVFRKVIPTLPLCRGSTLEEGEGVFPYVGGVPSKRGRGYFPM